MRKKKKQSAMTHTFRLIKKPWCDVDYKMLHACFEFLCDFVEKEKGLKMLKYQYEWYEQLTREQKIIERKNMGTTIKEINKNQTAYKKTAREVEELYNWWKDVYVPQYKSGDWRPESVDGHAEEEQRNFHRLVEIRRYLWT